MVLKKLLFGVCDVFEEMKVPYALIDGYSAVVHGAPCNNLDIGLVASPQNINAELIEKLKGIGLEPTANHDDIEHLHSFGQFVNKETGIVVHIFTEFRGVVPHEGVGTEVWEVDGKNIHVCNPARSVIMKASICARTDKVKTVVLSKSNEKNPVKKILEQ